MRDSCARSRTACRSRSKVVSRLIDLGSLVGHDRPLVATARRVGEPARRSSRRSAGPATHDRPAPARRSSRCQAAPASPPTSARRHCRRRTDSGHRRVATSLSVTTVRPSGLSSSEAIFAISLFGASPIEQLSPVASRTACFSSAPTSRAHHQTLCSASSGSTGLLVVRQARGDDVGQIDVDLVDAAILDLRCQCAHCGLEQPRVLAVLVEVHRQQHRVRRLARPPSSCPSPN